MQWYLAMSCFQGRRQDSAFEALIRHQPTGVQLTPGNLPTPNFEAQVRAWPGQVRMHHGFVWQQRRRRIYDDSGNARGIAGEHSIHPPRSQARPTQSADYIATANTWLPLAASRGLVLETMYPGYVLGTGDELALAMDLAIPLAVDVSHLHIQRCLGVLSATLERRLQAYDRIVELHVSANDGRVDSHRAIHADTPGLAWARERGATLPVILESYWHAESFDSQRRQIDCLLAGS